MAGGAGVIVVGAGPAGSVTALLLARAGIRVRIVERARFPREKPCGDCLSAAAGTLLERLGLLAAVERLAPAHLAGWSIRGPRDSGFRADFDHPQQADARARFALALPRAVLDAELLRQAEHAGAEILGPATVEDLVLERGVVCGVRTRSGACRSELRADLVVGADGLRSRVSRRLGLGARAARLRKLSLTTHVQLPAPLSPVGEMHVARGLCIGLAPVNAAGTLCNLTVVADADRYGAEVRSDPHRFMTAALARFPALPDTLRTGTRGALLASGPFDLPTRGVWHPGAALVGDAAGYFDPFTGQGIYQAMAGAELLAAAALGPLADGRTPPPPVLAQYARAHRRLTSGPRRVQRLIDAVIARPNTAQHALSRIARRPRVARTLLAVTGDLAPARSLLSPALLISFLVPHPRRP